MNEYKKNSEQNSEHYQRHRPAFIYNYKPKSVKSFRGPSMGLLADT